MPNKERERLYLAALQDLIPDIPSDEPESPEPPDFIFRRAAGALGIELTVFHLPPTPGERSHQQQRAMESHVVAEAERIHREAGGRAQYVWVAFSNNARLNRRSMNSLSREIARLTHLDTSLDSTYDVPVDELPEGVTYIRVEPSIDGRDRLWYPDHAGWVASVLPEHIEDVIARKARTVIASRRHADELWLVIVDDVFSGAAPARLSDQAVAAQYNHPFDRLIWFDAPARRLTDLRPQLSSNER
jgi:hypothetical protein